MTQKPLRRLAWWLAAAWAAACPVMSGSAQTGQSGQAAADSSFWSFSIQELQDYRKYTIRQMDALRREKKKLIRKGIETGERLLAEKSGSQYLDDILIRLADLTYLEEKDATLDSMKAAEDREAVSGVKAAVEPEPDFSGSMALYQRILDSFSKGEFVDDALYNQGFLFEETGDHASANRVFERLIDRFPDSRFAVEASMRLAEYSFNPPVNDLAKAISYYERVTGKPTNPRYPEALYKLGWSHYRLSQFPSAISYFTTLIETVAARSAREGEPAAADLKDESIDYIAVCFVDFGGPAAAAEYLRKIGKPAWGPAVLEKLGRVYMEEKEDYPDAILAYGFLLEADPAFSEAPGIQMRIANCRRLMKDETGAFEARHRLFLTYRAGGVWWSVVTDGKRRQDARLLCEQALRENFQWLVRRAESASQGQAFYMQAVELGREYLEAFPDDVHSLLIRWNMALVLETKLRQYREALLEYFAISMAYTDEPYQAFGRAEGLPSTQDAAENAVVMADTLVRRDRHAHVFAADSAGAAAAGAGLPGGQAGLPLADSEKWLALAYDNYIKLFPLEPKTQTMLINAGILYYGHRNYTDALRYFKTLIKNFPEGRHLDDVAFSVIDSYFGNRDYVSAEIYCKKLLQDEGSAAIRAKAMQRLGEAIFRNAQEMSGSGRSKEAGDEFVRMALEAPKVDFRDRALFNAGREYDKAKDLESAIRAYEMLRASCPGSKFLQDALNNLAIDYGEKKDFMKAAGRYEELYGQLNEGPKAKDALYNALSYSAMAEDWIKAIELGGQYATRYRDAADAPRIYFQSAENYRKIEDLRGMEGIYRRLPTLFPDSPLAVECLFRLGKIEFERDSTDARAAEHLFTRAVRKSDSLTVAGLTADPAVTAEALYLASRIQQKRFESIAFRLPEPDMRRAMEEKQALLQALSGQYAKVASYRTGRLPESLFRIGEAHEKFARAWAEQEIPALDPIARAVKEKTVHERTRRIYGEGLEAYLGGLRVLDRIRKDNGLLSGPLTGPPSVEASGLAASGLAASGLAASGLAAGDSSRSADNLAYASGFWSGRIRPKISEALFRMAEIQTRSIDDLLRAPVPAELSDMAKLEYRSQVLVKVIKPLVDGAAEAHRRNLTVADSLAMTNAWVDSSRSQIQAALGLLSRNYEALAWDALGRYGHWMQLHHNNSGEPWKLPAEWTDMVLNSLELSKSYSQAVILFGRDGIQKAALSGVGPELRLHDQETLIRFALRLADSLGILIAEAGENQKLSEALYTGTKDARLENMPALFGDNLEFIGKFRTSILEDAYAADRMFDPPSPSGGWIAARLIRMDPDNGPVKLNLKLDSVSVATDTTWLQAAGNPSASAEETGGPFEWTAVRRDTAGAGPAGAAAVFTRIRSSTADTLMLRRMIEKEFIVPGIPVFGSLELEADPPGRLFINGKPAAAGRTFDIADISALVLAGRNRLRLECSDAASFSAAGRLQVKYIAEKLPAGANR